MSFTLIVDSNCDLSQSLLKQYDIGVIPTQYYIKGAQFQEYRDTDEINEFYRTNKKLTAKNYSADASTVNTIKNIILEKVEQNPENDILIQTLMRTRSKTYENTNLAISAILSIEKYKKLNIKVMNTGTAYAGQALFACHSIALRNKGVSMIETRRRVEAMVDNMRSYVMPPNIKYAREQVAKKGVTADGGVSWLTAQVGSALGVVPIVLLRQNASTALAKARGIELALEKIVDDIKLNVDNLLSPFICISYAGKMDELLNNPSYLKLLGVIHDKKIKLVVTPMCVAGGIVLGLGCVSIAYATRAPFNEDAAKELKLNKVSSV
ncbi:MAG: DegV family protein [Saccharospirillaceae bacterium]|nr:DegV family protein [Pseudomonadales bacterium]NRB79491.1 DegV family protein [Saccharospirillaceae bacterium]